MRHLESMVSIGRRDDKIRLRSYSDKTVHSPQQTITVEKANQADTQDEGVEIPRLDLSIAMTTYPSGSMVDLDELLLIVKSQESD